MSEQKKKIIQDVIIPARNPTPRLVSSEKKDVPIISSSQKIQEEKRYSIDTLQKKYDPNNHPSKRGKKTIGVWFFAIITLIALVLVIGVFFAQLTIVVTPKRATVIVDNDILLNQEKNRQHLFFGTVSELIERTTNPINPENREIATIELRKEITEELYRKKQQMIKEIPEHMILFPIIIAEPITFSEIVQPEGMVITAKTTATLFIVDSVDFAKMIQIKNNRYPDLQMKVVNYDDVLATTNTLVSSSDVPTMIPVRLTGQITLEGIVSKDLIIKNVAGAKISSINEWLKKYAELEAFSVHHKPFWRRVVSENIDTITIINNHYQEPIK